MTIAPRYPSLYQLNTRVWLRCLSRERDKRVTLAEIEGKQLLLTDLMGSQVHYRDGRDLVLRGLYIDQAPWQINVFELRSIAAAA